MQKLYRSKFEKSTVNNAYLPQKKTSKNVPSAHTDIAAPKITGLKAESYMDKVEIPDKPIRFYGKSVDNSDESGIIKEEKLNIFNRIKSGELPLDINTGNQNKHISTSHSYDKDKKKSILYGDLNLAKELVDKYHGTGSLKFTSKGKWTNKEFIEAESDIGEVFDNETQKYVKTNRFAIHYGKNGTHIVPRERRK